MVRFSKTIQRAIPQKIRRSASMLKCETTPFCNTPKYATIVLRSSGALKHWLVSSVASLARSLVWGAAASSRRFPHDDVYTTTTTSFYWFLFVYWKAFFIYSSNILVRDGKFNLPLNLCHHSYALSANCITQQLCKPSA